MSCDVDFFLFFFLCFYVQNRCEWCWC